jgi:hypothetical protein
MIRRRARWSSSGIAMRRFLSAIFEVGISGPMVRATRPARAEAAAGESRLNRPRAARTAKASAR